MSDLDERYFPAAFLLSFVVTFGIPAWLFFRLIIGFADRSSQSLPREIFALSVWFQRFFLCLIAGCLVIIYGGKAVDSLLGRGWHVPLEQSLEFWVLAFYAAVSLVTNFPGFPLRWSLVVFWRSQVLLAPLVLVVFRQPHEIFSILVGMFCFAAFWLWNLSERLAIEPYEELERSGPQEEQS